ncbi:MAG TPA: hypothetical protein VMW73_00325 [Spirochaetia bacterium]|nr:hypothetical protein [Spirochaetia bacterium]
MKKQLTVFGNPISRRAVRRATHLFSSYAARFNYSADWIPKLASDRMPGAWEQFGIRQLVDGGAITPGENPEPEGVPAADSKAIIIGTIRMGFGHYRIGLAIASAARSMGLDPYWLDFLSFPGSAASQAIEYLNNLYSFGSRLSQKVPLFDHFIWERITSQIALKLDYCARDRELSRLYAPLLGNLDRSLPFLSTHPWTGQAAIHAGMRSVVTVVPDNYPLAFHLVEGSVHAVQTPSNYFGYRTLRNMGSQDRGPLTSMPESDVQYTGHFVDHEIVSNIDADCGRRLLRLREGSPRRFLLTIGGAGAQLKRFYEIIRFCRGAIESDRLAMLVNLGDHHPQWLSLKSELEEVNIPYTLHSDWSETRQFAADAVDGPMHGLHIFLHGDIFAAVYTTNLLMRVADLLITKPSELSFYPVPKLFIQRVGQHEAWGAIRGAELGDGTLETDSLKSLQQTLTVILNDTDLLEMYCTSIMQNNKIGTYDGAYRAVMLARTKASEGQLRE